MTSRATSFARRWQEVESLSSVRDCSSARDALLRDDRRVVGLDLLLGRGSIHLR